MDANKILVGLKHCSLDRDDMDCGHCPYGMVDKRTCIEQLATDALNMVMKQQDDIIKLRNALEMCEEMHHEKVEELNERIRKMKRWVNMGGSK